MQIFEAKDVDAITTLCAEVKKLREENSMLKGELIGILEGILLYEDKLPLSVVEAKKQRLQELKEK
jgi:hypothetical protein